LFIGVELVTDHESRNPATAEAEHVIRRYRQALTDAIVDIF